MSTLARAKTLRVRYSEESGERVAIEVDVALTHVNGEVRGEQFRFEGEEFAAISAAADKPAAVRLACRPRIQAAMNEWNATLAQAAPAKSHEDVDISGEQTEFTGAELGVV